MTAPVQHGTKRGYAAHLRAKEQPCDECAAGNADSSRAHRILCGDRKTITFPIALLGEILIGLDEDTSHRVGEAIGHETTEACMEVASWTALKNSGTAS